MVVALDGRSGMARLLAPGLDWRLEPRPERPGPLEFARFIRRLRPALVQTYNWGAIEAAAAKTIQARRPPGVMSAQRPAAADTIVAARR